MKLVSVIFAVALAGCATTNSHDTMRGSVVMKINASDAHVCLGQGEVAAGDQVTLFHNVCTTGDKVTPLERCHREAVGKGQVVEVLNSHYSVVRFPAGTTFQEGDTVERSK